MAYPNNSSRRFFSSTSPVGAPNLISKSAMRDRRSSIFFLTAAVSCRCAY